MSQQTNKEKKPVFTKESIKTLLRIVRDTKSIRPWLLIGAFISVISVGLSLIGPQLLGGLTNSIYDSWSGTVALNMPAFLNTCLLLCAVYLMSAGCSSGTMLIMNNVVSRHFTCRIRIEISDKLKRLPVKYMDDTPNGEIISKMTNDVSVMGNTIHNILNIIIDGVMKLCGIAVIIFLLNPLMAAAVIVFVPLSLVLASVIAQRSETYFRKSRELNGKIYALAEEDFTGFDTVKAFHLEKRQQGAYAKLCDACCEQLTKGYYLSGVVQPVVTLTNNLAYIVICILGGYLALSGKMDVGGIVAFILYAKLFAGPLESIANGLSMMQNTFASAGRVYELLDLPEMDVLPPSEVPNGRGGVQFDHVSFRYRDDQPLLEDLNLDIKPGQKIAIVGPTGGGKTTIVNLLMRFYDPCSGHILIDGRPTSQIPREALRECFGMVLQDTWLFSGTIYDNIAYGKEGATREEVLDAARRAHIDHFVDTLPQGYDTVINEESGNISAGQKQLLTIARAYLSDRPILILDEATSNVDTRTEILIQQTMDELMKRKTSFVIAHRLSTIVNADLILVVDNGHIVETGTHRALLAKDGFYAKIYNSQYQLLS